MELHPSTKDLTGQQFGRLRVVSFAGYLRHGAHWNCYCRCTQTTYVRAVALRIGSTTSCGCYGRQMSGQAARNRKKFLKGTPEYNSWQLAKDRCYNSNNKSFAYYGGRGITMCDRWLHSPGTFSDDMGKRPAPGYSLDRINNGGNYDPSNCRWATMTDQVRNRRNTLRLTYKGVTRPVAEWAEIYNLNRGTIAFRLRSGWSAHDALTKPSARTTK